MGVFSKAAIVCFVFLLGCFVSFTQPLANQLIGVLPLTNQREIPQDDWVGFYIQSRLQSYLTESLSAEFYPPETLRLWYHRSKNRGSVSKKNTVILTGSFQKVLQIGIIDIEVKRILPEKTSRRFKTQIDWSNVTKELDTLFHQISVWIDPKAKAVQNLKHPQFDSEPFKVSMEFRKELFFSGKTPEVQAVARMKTMVNHNSHPETVGDFAAAMIMLTENLLLNEKKSFLTSLEQLLRSTAMNHPKNARIHALLAAVFYLNHQEPGWVLATSSKALEVNPHNSLALLMQIVTSESPDSDIKADVDKLYEINPWIWPRSGMTEMDVRFFNGVFDNDLQKIIEKAKDK